MTEIAKKAMDKLRDEMAKQPDDDGIAQIGEYMTARLAEDEALAGAVLADKKTLGGAFGAMRDYARKHQSGGFAYVSPEKAIEIVCAYFGVHAEAPKSASDCGSSPAVADDLDLDRLLGL